MLMLSGDDGMGSWEMDLKRVTVSMNGRKEQPEGHQELKCHFGQKRFANTKISTDLANQLSQRWSIDLKLWEKRSFASWVALRCRQVEETLTLSRGASSKDRRCTDRGCLKPVDREYKCTEKV
jgi:hypothetical protein